MPEANGVVKEIRAAFERDPRVNIHRSRIQISAPGNKVILDGEVLDIAAKRAMVDCAQRAAAGKEIVDHICVMSPERVGDGAIRDLLAELLFEEPVFLRSALDCRIAGDREAAVREPDNADNRIRATVAGGIITLSGHVMSLSHRRFAEVLAWWTRGCRNVVNELDIQPPEDDNDGEMSDAIDLVLDKDPIVHSDQVTIRVRDGHVTVRGLVATKEERRMVERDIWYVAGVRDVLNEIDVYPARTPRESIPASPPEFE